MTAIVRRRNQSHPLARHVDVVDNDGHGEQEQTELLFSRKPLMKSTFFLSLFIFHTRTVTPRYQPPSMADSITSPARSLFSTE